jgi:hypothetical protein
MEKNKISVMLIILARDIKKSKLTIQDQIYVENGNNTSLKLTKRNLKNVVLSNLRPAKQSSGP